MADDPNATPSTPTTPPQPNSPEARTVTGEIKDASPSPQPDPKSTPTDKSTTSDKTLAAAADDKKPGDDKAPAAVPEKYEFKAPEGYEIDPAVVEKATPLFKELGLNQDQAQKIFDIYAENAVKGESQLVDAYETMRDGWRKEIVADKSLGDGQSGLNQTTKQNIAAAITAMPAELQTAFKDAMDLTGAGDNPAFIRAIAALGAQFREGTAVRGANPSPLGQKAPGSKPTSAAQAMYPNLPSSVSQS